MAVQEGLVAGNAGSQASATRLERQPRFACQLGIVPSPGAGLRDAVSGPRPWGQA